MSNPRTANSGIHSLPALPHWIGRRQCRKIQVSGLRGWIKYLERQNLELRMEQGFEHSDYTLLRADHCNAGFRRVIGRPDLKIHTGAICCFGIFPI
jgi:hypothetical protein